MNDSKIEATALARLHAAMLEELGRRGPGDIRLGVVLRQAEIAEADFLAAYDDVEGCLFGAYASLTEHLDGAVREACRDAAAGARGTWPARVRAGLSALLGELARDPARAGILVQGFPAIGPRAQARFQAFVESFAPLLADGRKEAGSGAELPSEVETLAVGAAEAIVFEEIVSGRATELRKLQPAITFSLLVPFLGPVRAGAEMQGPEP